MMYNYLLIMRIILYPIIGSILLWCLLTFIRNELKHRKKRRKE